MVGLVCKPKKESLMVVPPLAASAGEIFLGLLFSDGVVGFTDFLTAANTTLANDIPDADPRSWESEVPWTETIPMLLTSLSYLV